MHMYKDYIPNQVRMQAPHSVHLQYGKIVTTVIIFYFDLLLLATS